jgi:mono/diheme cytochrome c family protein
MEQMSVDRTPAPAAATRGTALAVFLGFAVTVGGLLGSGPASAKPLPNDAGSIKRGASIYAQNCSSCHGLSGRGEGPVARSYNPPPTDFTRGEFRHGKTDNDLVKSITIGVPGTGMSGWKGKLSDAEIAAVAAYIRSLQK